MSAGLRGDVGKLRQLERSIRQLPLVVAHEVAAQSASTITALARQTFGAGENAYGDSWEPGEDGKRVDLHKSGRLAAGVEYVSTGTKLRARLGPEYARFQVGRRPVFPRGGARLPLAYVQAISAKASAIIRARLGKVAA